jgi:hypothetical protein
LDFLVAGIAVSGQILGRGGDEVYQFPGEGKEASKVKLSGWSHGESNPDLSLAKAPFYR